MRHECSPKLGDVRLHRGFERSKRDHAKGVKAFPPRKALPALGEVERLRAPLGHAAEHATVRGDGLDLALIGPLLHRAPPSALEIDKLKVERVGAKRFKRRKEPDLLVLPGGSGYLLLPTLGHDVH